MPLVRDSQRRCTLLPFPTAWLFLAPEGEKQAGGLYTAVENNNVLFLFCLILGGKLLFPTISIYYIYIQYIQLYNYKTQSKDAFTNTLLYYNTLLHQLLFLPIKIPWQQFYSKINKEFGCSRAFFFILLLKQRNKLSNVFGRMKANAIRAKTVFVHQPQQGLQASSVGCSPPSWLVRSLLQPRVMLSLEWDGDQRHICRSLHNADGELPCKLNVQKHNVKNKTKQKTVSPVSVLLFMSCDDVWPVWAGTVTLSVCLWHSPRWRELYVTAKMRTVSWA